MDRREFILKGTGLGILGGISLIGMAQEPDDKPKKYTVIAKRCDGCGRCLNACRHKALSFDNESKACIDSDKCTGCGDCTRFCRRVAIVEINKKA
jgi:ferredoxin